jgi:hypothetical protein
MYNLSRDSIENYLMGLFDLKKVLPHRYVQGTRYPFKSMSYMSITAKDYTLNNVIFLFSVNKETHFGYDFFFKLENICGSKMVDGKQIIQLSLNCRYGYDTHIRYIYTLYDIEEIIKKLPLEIMREASINRILNEY